MADEKKLERIYTVNLSGAYSYLRTRRAERAVKMLRSYLSRHFKVEQKGVRLSSALNSYLWRDSIQRPPRRVKVRGVREGGIVNVYLHGEDEAAAALLKKKTAKKDAAAKKKEARAKQNKGAKPKKEEKKSSNGAKGKPPAQPKK